MLCNSNRTDAGRSPVRKGGEVHHLMVMVVYYLVIQLGSLGKLTIGLSNQSVIPSEQSAAGWLRCVLVTFYRCSIFCCISRIQYIRNLLVWGG